MLALLCPCWSTTLGFCNWRWEGTGLAEAARARSTTPWTFELLSSGVAARGLTPMRPSATGFWVSAAVK